MPSITGAASKPAAAANQNDPLAMLGQLLAQFGAPADLFHQAINAGKTGISGGTPAHYGGASGHMPGYASGGYTGESMGVVHPREFVAHAGATARYRPELEAMNRGTYGREDSRNFRELGRMISAAVSSQTEALSAELAELKAENKRMADEFRRLADKKPAPGRAA